MMKNRRKSNNTHKKNKWLNAILIVILCISSYFIVIDIRQRVQSAQANDAIQQSNPAANVVSNVDTGTAKQVANPSISELKRMNPDIVGWIYIKGTNIDYPLLQCSNNDYYLDHTYTEEYNNAGSIFLDYMNAADFSDQNTVIYGHSQLDRTMFYQLKYYRQQSFYDQYPFIVITTENYTYYYRVLSVNVLAPTDNYRGPDYGSGFYDHIAAMRSSSLIVSSADINSNSKIITLSTCTNSIEDGRLVITAVLLNPIGEKKDLSENGFWAEIEKST